MSGRYWVLGAALALVLAAPGAALGSGGGSGGSGGGGGSATPALSAEPCAQLSLKLGAEFIAFASNAPLVVNADVASCSSVEELVTLSFQETPGLVGLCGIAPASSTVDLRPGERKGVTTLFEIPLSLDCVGRFVMDGSVADEAGNALAAATAEFVVFRQRRD